MSTARLRYLSLVLVMGLVLGGILACDIGSGPSKPTITITAPTSDTQFEEGEDVIILSSANDAKGVTRVELYVDGGLYRTDSSPGAEGEKSLAMAQTWVAADPGRHSLSVIAYNVDGAESDPWAVTLEVVEAGGAVTPPPAATNTPLPPPEATATTPPPSETVPPPPPTDTAEPELPDLVLERLSINPSDPDWDESIEVAVDIANVGHAPSGPYTVFWSGALTGITFEPTCEWNQPSLPPNNGGTLRCTVEHVRISATTVAMVDPPDDVEESNEDNNSMELAMVVGPSPPNLHVTDIRIEPTSPVMGSPAHVGVKIHNQGETAAHNFKVVWRSGEPGGELEWTVTSLAGGAYSSWLQYPYTYTGHGHFTTRAIVDSDGDVDEIDDGDNESIREIDVIP
jgi:hypothetical protein